MQLIAWIALTNKENMEWNQGLNHKRDIETKRRGTGAERRGTETERRRTETERRGT